MYNDVIGTFTYAEQTAVPANFLATIIGSLEAR